MSQYTWTNPGAPSTFPADQRNWSPPPSLNIIGGGAKPFGQGDWPNPTTLKPRAVLDFIGATEIQLIGKDKFFGAPGQGPAYDWPNPRGYTPGISLKTHTDWFKLELIGKDKFFGAPGQGPAYDWPNPTTRTPRGIDLFSWIATLDLSLNAGVVVVPPFYQTDYPNPTRLTPRAVQDFLAGLQLNLLGQDVFFGAAGQGVANLDWPNPTRLNARLVDYFVDSFKLTLAGKDKFFGAAGQGPAYDWPNPTRLAPRAVDLRITEGVKQNLGGKDQFFGAAGQGPNYDWPNPTRLTPRGVDLRITEAPKLNLQGQDQFFGAPGQAPAYLDWPVPRGPTPGIALKSWWQYLQGSTLAVTVAPFYQSDYPNPQGYPFGITQRTFTDPVKLPLIGKDKFFGAAGQGPAQLDWPVPYGARQSIDLKTWAQALLESTLAPVVAPPFYQTDYPNPRGYTAGIALKTHTDPVKLNLRGKDRFFGAAGQGPANLDWPVPQAYKLAITQRSWSQNLLQSTIAPVILNPFHQTDYPNPRGYSYVITLRFEANMVITDQSGVTWTDIVDPDSKPWSDIPED